ncbi:ankyrin repeat and SOCS box protein 3 [Nephila pilipes]|uniref:Ankyrin repeat and SOCS box protein 3 n=1 Tax=Nephila pilipes TaxID=299642 RepID=A0A8X6KD72_NEPPI|nr:ankyrin repeat and SOCS box protein 3 [Nephila pilipes]
MNFAESWSDTCSSVGYATREGNMNLLENLLKEKKPVDVADNRGWRPLHEAAAASPSIDCLEKLLKHGGTDINWTTHEGETALLLACKRRQGVNANAFVRLLLQHGADPNILDNEEDSPLLEAVRNANRYVVEQLVLSGANVNATDCSKWSPLHEAAANKDPNLLQLLLSNEACIDVQDECGMTPIFTAAQHGCKNCLQELLHVAKERNQEQIVNIGAEDWATPLMIAAQQGFVDCVEILLDNGADPNLKTSDNATALHLAVQGDNKSCLEILLEKMNLEPLIKAFHPSTYEDINMICPVHLAVEWGSYGSLRALLAVGFSPDSLYTCSDQALSRMISYLPTLETAISYAAFKSDRMSISILLAAGASCSPPVPESSHPLLRAMTHAELDVFQIFIENGTNVNYQRHSGASNEVFLYALLTYSSYLRLLLYHGCDPNLCFQNECEMFFFVRCAGSFLRRERIPLRDFLKLMLRFLLVSKTVQSAFYELNTMFMGDISDILEELNRPSPLKQICTVKLRQHLYSIHGVRLPDVIQHLFLPSILEEYIICNDLKFWPD